MLVCAYDTLLRQSGSEARCQLSSVSPDAYVMPWKPMTTSEAEITVVFCICVLAEIGNAKNNIIGVCFFVSFVHSQLKVWHDDLQGDYLIIIIILMIIMCTFVE